MGVDRPREIKIGFRKLSRTAIGTERSVNTNGIREGPCEPSPNDKGQQHEARPDLYDAQYEDDEGQRSTCRGRRTVQIRARRAVSGTMLGQ